MMLRAWDAQIQDETGEKRLAVLRKRFAERYGGVGATLGRYVEKGQGTRAVRGQAFRRGDEVVPPSAIQSTRSWSSVEKTL